MNPSTETAWGWAMNDRKVSRNAAGFDPPAA